MILLSMLGASPYEPTRYTWKDQTSSPYPLVQQALVELLRPKALFVFATPKANEHHGEKIRSIPEAHLVEIPNGEREAEYWEIFSIIERTIPARAELALDITHGFRSLPVLVLLAVSFLRSAKQAQLKHVLYGAYEARQDGRTPIFDLSPLIAMLDWASATDRFLETGDARKFRLLVSHPTHPSLNSATSKLSSLSEALATNRALRSGKLAQEALKQIEQAEREGFAPHQAPLNVLFPQLRHSLKPLARDKHASPEDQLKQLFTQIEWLAQNQRFEKAIGLAREWRKQEAE